MSKNLKTTWLCHGMTNDVVKNFMYITITKKIWDVNKVFYFDNKTCQSSLKLKVRFMIFSKVSLLLLSVLIPCIGIGKNLIYLKILR